MAGKLLHFHTVEHPKAKIPIRLPRSVHYHETQNTFTCKGHPKWRTTTTKNLCGKIPLLQAKEKASASSKHRYCQRPMAAAFKDRCGHNYFCKPLLIFNFFTQQPDKINWTLCSRNFQNVKLRLDFFDVW